MKEIDWLAMGKRFGIDAVILLLTAVLASAIMGVLVVQEVISAQTGGLLAEILFAAVLYAISFSTAKGARCRKLVIAVCVGIMSVILMMLVKTIIFSNEHTAFDWKMLLAIGETAVAGILANQNKRIKR